MKIQRRLKITFLSSIMAGLLAHIFALTNVLQNYDNMAILPGGYGTGLTSGRWFLTILGNFLNKIWGNYNIPFFNGLLTIVILSVTACVIVLLTDVRSELLCAIWGGIFLCFPAVTSLLFFMYTAPYYALAVFMAVIAVWFTEKYKYGLFPAALLCAASLGIYQAYFPMTITLFVVLLIQYSLTNGSDFRTLFCKGLLYLAELCLSLLAYFVLLKASLKFYKLSLSNYQGVDEMGLLRFEEIPSLLKRTYFQFLKIPFKDYCGISATPTLKLSILLLGVISILVIGFLLFSRKRKWNIRIGCILLCLVFPFSVNSIIVMCPNSNIYTLMVYTSVFIYLIPLLLLDWMQKDFLQGNRIRIIQSFKKVVIIFFSVIILNYIWLSNGNYISMYYTVQQTNNYFNSMITQAKMTEGYNSSLRWAFIGDTITDPHLKNPGGVRYFIMAEMLIA